MAIPTILEYVALFAPQYVGDARLTTAIALAENAHSAGDAVNRWGNRYTEAMAHYAIHVLRTTPVDADAGDAEDATGTSGDTGTVRSKTTGQYSITYGQSASDAARAVGASDEDAWLLTTKDGRAYLAIRRTRLLAAPALVSVGGATGGPIRGWWTRW